MKVTKISPHRLRPTASGDWRGGYVTQDLGMGWERFETWEDLEGLFFDWPPHCRRPASHGSRPREGYRSPVPGWSVQDLVRLAALMSHRLNELPNLQRWRRALMQLLELSPEAVAAEAALALVTA